MAKKKKSNRGGKRKGAGRKKLAPTTTVSFRVKIELAEQVKQVVTEFLSLSEEEKKLPASAIPEFRTDEWIDCYEQFFGGMRKSR
jgi:hypothetical protein